MDSSPPSLVPARESSSLRWPLALFATDYDDTMTVSDTTRLLAHLTVAAASDLPPSPSFPVPAPALESAWTALGEQYGADYGAFFSSLLATLSSTSASEQQQGEAGDASARTRRLLTTALARMDDFERAMAWRVQQPVPKGPSSSGRQLPLAGIPHSWLSEGPLQQQQQQEGGKGGAGAMPAASDTASRPASFPAPVFRPHCLRTLARISSALSPSPSPSPSRSFSILSANWSASFVRSTLVVGEREEGLGTGAASPLARMRILANELKVAPFPPAGSPLRTTGRFDLRICGSGDKARALAGELEAISAGAGAAAGSPANPRGLVVYVGDSPMDVAALLAADIGIVMRRGDGRRVGDDGLPTPPSSLHRLATALGVSVLPIEGLAATRTCVDELTARAALPLRRRLDAEAEQDEEAAAAAGAEGKSSPSSATFTPRVRALVVESEGARRPVLWEATGWDEIAACLLLLLPGRAADPGAADDNVREFIYAGDAGLSLLPPMVAARAKAVAASASAAAGGAALASKPSQSPSPPLPPPRVLIVAGSDSGGGAGIQADIKACAALGAFSMTAVTAITAQDTRGVHGVHGIPPAMLEQQLRVCLADLGADVVKTGMLPDAAAIETVARVLEEGRRRDQPSSSSSSGLPLLIVDPVMVSASGHALIAPEAVAVLAARLLPHAHLVTPNLPEASLLLGGRVLSTVDDMVLAGRDIARLGGPGSFVLLKGGHLEGETSAVVVDVLVERDTGAVTLFRSPRTATTNTHGTGCTLASSVASCLARGLAGARRRRQESLSGGGGGSDDSPLPLPDLPHLTREAVASARAYLQTILHASADVSLGAGAHGPMNHAAITDAWGSGDSVWRAASGATTDPTPAAPAPAAHPTPVPFDLRLYAVTDPGMNAKHGRTLEAAVEAAIAGGATLVQLREKDAGTADFVAAARRVMDSVRLRRRATDPRATTATAAAGLTVVINDRIDVALACGADGAHVGQGDMDAATARALLGPSAILGVTVTNPDEARAAERAGANYLGTNAIFATATKADSSPIGPQTLADICAAVRIPVVAIGGINARNVAEVLGCGLPPDDDGENNHRRRRQRQQGDGLGPDGVAVVSALFDQLDVEAATRALRNIVDAALLPPRAAGTGGGAPHRFRLPPIPAALPPAQVALTSLPVRVPSFALACLSASADVWRACHDHPFVVALADGTLPVETFRRYQMSDALYLQGFGDACALVASRCGDVDEKEWFLDAAKLSLVVERDLHLQYGRELNYGPADLAALDLSPNAKAYVDHLLAAASTGSSLVEAVAALVPCPHLYSDIGRDVLRRRFAVATEADGSVVAEIPASHPYARWLLQYGDTGFVDYTARILSILQRHAELNGWREGGGLADLDLLPPHHPLRRACKAFLASCRLEYMFWDQAWTGQGW